MTLEEAIQHCHEVAKENRKTALEYARAYAWDTAHECRECAKEHGQLALWLTELKSRRIAAIKELVAKQPTIEPEVRHGRWLSLKGWFNKSIVKCSVCGNTLNMDGVNAGRGDANFCPNCGAKMDLRTPTEVELDIVDSVMMGDIKHGD